MEKKNQMIYFTSIDTTLRNFQYKFLMRLIPTNKYLLRCKLSSSNLCDFCNMNIETTKHLFWECQYVQNFWTEFNQFLNSKNINYTINFKDISFGIMDNFLQNDTLATNFIIMLAKYFIFKMKLKNIIPHIEQFKNYLNQRITTETEIAIFKNKLDKHNLKWLKFMRA